MAFTPIDKSEIKIKTDSEVDSAPIIIGQSDKSIFGEAQNRAAGFAGRMNFANSRMNKFEAAGFNPVNYIDVLKDNLPFVPEWFERVLQSPQYKMYNVNKINFSTAQLRRETGAVINDSEIVWINETYFPQLGDGPEVAALKKEARFEAVKAMETEAGKAYKGLKQEDYANNPELAERINKILRRLKNE